MWSLASSLFAPFWFVFPEIILYGTRKSTGAFAVLLALDIYIVMTRRKQANGSSTKANVAVLAVGALMFMMATLHICASLYNSYFYNLLNSVELIYASVQNQLSQSTRECLDQNQSSLPLSVHVIVTTEFKITASQEVQMVAFVVQLWLGDGFMFLDLKGVRPRLHSDELYYPIVMNAIVPIIGIAFSLIVIRMGLGVTTEMHLQTSGAGRTIPRSAGHSWTGTNSIMLFAPGPSTNTEDPESKTTF
ncbi:hypothetical protein CONPUDRAFT_77765 [Coniophora puteana RWD-64-598 SS2]|uniref:Uncharacterized protein n=1 Tax=Coniophora puteana (strain RWD-64-598) TaxID=741705 RepID=A0A5M3M7F7_CONPW|nr:uncharacterized protein CONPUDRAFT_77765 [Coniophora puteana RWD-64-598 SS2]EIW74983.1 hypothetical protein CONPUDRAFT_77765 [Coniophora puteana RWD-64-598 SS2]